MRTRRNLVTGIAAAALALTACGIAAGSSGGTPAAVSAGHAPASTWVTQQGDLAQVKRHIAWGGDPAQAQRPQADPSRVTGQQDLAKVKRDVVLQAGQQAGGQVSARAVPVAARAAGGPAGGGSPAPGYNGQPSSPFQRGARCPGRLASMARVRSASGTICRS